MVTICGILDSDGYMVWNLDVIPINNYYRI